MMQRFARRLHGRIAVSAAARHFIGRYFPGEYKVIPNGVDLAQFDDVPPFARWRDGIPNILFVGRFESRKGLMYLLRAYYQLRLEGLGCRLLVVGHGPQAGEARRYIASRRLGGVEMLGRLSDHDKARAFATADIYASPATGQESFGIVLLEAMAAGVPIVCSDIHGYKGVVRRNEQALLVPPRDVEALAAALGTLLRDPLLRERMGESGRERAEQFGWETVTAKVEDYYGFVIRRLAARRLAAAGLPAPIPEAPARRRHGPACGRARPSRRSASRAGTPGGGRGRDRLRCRGASCPVSLPLRQPPADARRRRLVPEPSCRDRGDPSSAPPAAAPTTTQRRDERRSRASPASTSAAVERRGRC